MYIQEVFKDLGIINRIDKEKINVQCFLHGEKNGQSLFINFSKNYYQCYGKCQEKGNLQQLLIKLGSDTILNSQYLIETEINKHFIKSSQKELEAIDYSKHLYFYSKNISDIPYLNKRKLSKDIYQANKIYLNDYTKRITIPVTFEGKYYGNITRTIYSEKDTLNLISKETGIDINQFNKKDILFEIIYTDNPIYDKYRDMTIKTKWNERYLNDYFLPKDRILYEPLTNNPECNVYLLQEGCLDSLFSNQYGYNSYAVIGNGINENHVKYLLEKLEGKYLISAFDNDLAGQKYHEQLCKLANRFILRLDWGLIRRKVKDIPDISKEELDYLVYNATY